MRHDTARHWLATRDVLLTAGLLVLAYLIGDVLLLVFASILLAVGLDGLAGPLAAGLRVPRGLALILVGIALLGGLVLIGYFTAPQIVAQIGRIEDNLVAFGEGVRDWLAGLGAGGVVSDMNGDGGMAAEDVVQRVASWGMTTLDVATSFIVFLVIAFFAAADPALYRDGFLRLLPPDRRPLIDEALAMAAYALRWWFLGQLVSMLILGVTVGLGLYLIGIELWLSLAVITALMTFIPFLGPLIAGVPVLIVGFAEGVETGLIVAVFYLVVQNLEGNVIVPMIQHKAVNLAPALLISVQVLLSVVFGVLGLILAAPLTVVAMVAVKKLYLQGILGDPDAGAF